MGRKIVRFFVEGILIITIKLLFRVKKIGEENVPKEGACVLCANHISNWDPLTLVVYTKRKVRTMAKEELFNSRFLRIIAWIFEVFSVKRGTGDIEAIKTSLKILKDSDILAIYPEGTRKGMEKGVKPKNGAVLIALKAGVPIVPVAMQGNFKPFKKVRLIYGEPIYYNKEEIDTKNKDQIDELTNNLMKEIVSLRDADYTSKRLTKAKK